MNPLQPVNRGSFTCAHLIYVDVPFCSAVLLADVTDLLVDLRRVSDNGGAQIVPEGIS